MPIYIHLASADDIPLLRQLLNSQGNEGLMSTIADVRNKIEALTAKVTAENTVIDSAIAGFGGLAQQVTDLTQQLKAAIAADDPAGIDQAAADLENLGTVIDAEKTKLAAAIPANTDASSPVTS